MSDAEHPGLNLKVLVVVDKPDDRAYLEDLLAGKGFGVAAVHNGGEALKSVKKESYQLVLLDHDLPDMSGFELCRKVKGECPDLISVIVSDEPGESHGELLKYSVDEQVARPYRPEELSHMLEKYARYFQALREDERIREQLRAAEEKHRLFYEVGHQLKTPIAVMKEFTHLLREGFGGDLSDKQGVYLEAIDQNVDRLLSLVDQIEQLSRVDRGSWAVNIEAADPCTIVHQVVESWRPVLARHGVELAGEVEEGLPLVKVDTTAVEQVLFNLVDNAGKYGPAGGMVHVRCFRASDQHVQVEVEDQGPGIPEDKLELIFQPFTRLPEHESSAGLGLGLTVARGLMRRMGGDLWLESGRQPGNRFCLHVPVAEPSA